PQLPSVAYRAAVEQEIRKRGYSIESMLRAADAATTWDKDEAWDIVRAALEREHPKSSSLPYSNGRCPVTFRIFSLKGLHQTWYDEHDEQRVDNCKVAPALRGSKSRPDGCGDGVRAGSAR